MTFQFTYLSALVFAFCACTAFAQDARLPDQTAPPPLKIISRQDRTTLDSAKDPKARVRASLDLAESHLANCEAKTTQQGYDEAAAEAGQYRALVEDLFTYLGQLKQDSNKTRDLYKRVELSLRAQGPRFSVIRRGTPASYGIWIKEIEEFARHGRTEALNSFYGHTVVRDRPGDEKGAAKLQNSETAPKKP